MFFLKMTDIYYNYYSWHEKYDKKISVSVVECEWNK